MGLLGASVASRAAERTDTLSKCMCQGRVQSRARNIEGIGEVEEGVAIVGYYGFNGCIVVTL